MSYKEKKSLKRNNHFVNHCPSKSEHDSKMQSPGSNSSKQSPELSTNTKSPKTIFNANAPPIFKSQSPESSTNSPESCANSPELISNSSIFTSSLTLIRRKFSNHHLSIKIISHNPSYFTEESFTRRVVCIVLKHFIQALIQCLVIFILLYFQYFILVQISIISAKFVDGIQNMTRSGTIGRGSVQVQMTDVSASLHSVASNPWIQFFIHRIKFLIEFVNQLPLQITRMILRWTHKEHLEMNPFHNCFQYFQAIGLDVGFWSILFILLLNVYLARRFVLSWISAHIIEIIRDLEDTQDCGIRDPEFDEQLAWEEIVIIPDLGIQHSVYSPPGIFSFLSDSQQQQGEVERKFYSYHNLRSLIINEAMYKMGFIYYLGFLVKGEEDEIILLFGEIGEWMRRWILKYMYKDIRNCIDDSNIFKLQPKENQQIDACWIESEDWFQYVPQQVRHKKKKFVQSNTNHPLIEKTDKGKYFVSIDLQSDHFFTY